MSQVVIENPIINSPFDEPTRHFRFSDEGITDEVTAGAAGPVRTSFPGQMRSHRDGVLVVPRGGCFGR